ncbi:hypothetical protein DVJ78_18010 (plasmid) [Humibacter sp. BT305]|nr:hypothetical protein DVJ78_18010 [Humibacter sp. BT305]
MSAMAEDIKTIAARLLGALDDPNAPHLVMVTHPELVPGFCDFYGPYPSAMAAANAIDDVRATIDPTGMWTYTVHRLEAPPTP